MSLMICQNNSNGDWVFGFVAASVNHKDRLITQRAAVY